MGYGPAQPFSTPRRTLGCGQLPLEIFTLSRPLSPRMGRYVYIQMHLSADATYANGGHNGWVMDVCCPKCERRLWAQKVPIADGFDVWDFFDNEVRSDTYGQRVGLCVECGTWLTVGGGWPTRSVRDGHLKRNVELYASSDELLRLALSRVTPPPVL